MAIGPIIRRRREERSLSQGRLAQLARLSQGYLSKIENGSVKFPGVGSLYSLASALDMEPERLLREAGYPAPNEHHRPAVRANGFRVKGWTSWQSVPPCLSQHHGWVCPACSDWPQRYASAFIVSLTA